MQSTESVPQLSPEENRAKIIVINDERTAHYLTHLFKDRYDVMSVRNAEEALAVCRSSVLEGFTDFSHIIILTDLSLPDMELTTFNQIVSETVPLAKVVGMTDNETFDLVKHAVLMGLFDVFSKPLEGPVVYGKIEEMLGMKDAASSFRFDPVRFYFSIQKRRHDILTEVIALRQKINPMDPVLNLLYPKLMALKEHLTQVGKGRPYDFQALLETLAEELGEPVPVDGPRKIVLVEDEPETLQLLTMVYSPHYEVHVADTGLKGKALLESLPDVNVAVLDIMLPELSGIDLLGVIHRHQRHTEVIMLTGYKEREFVVRTLRFGAYQFLSKPMSRQDLLAQAKAAADLRFFKIALPHMVDQLEQATLSHDKRMAMLRTYCDIRAEAGESATLRDLFLFVPDYEVLDVTAFPDVYDHFKMPVKALVAYGLDRFMKAMSERRVSQIFQLDQKQNPLNDVSQKFALRDWIQNELRL